MKMEENGKVFLWVSSTYVVPMIYWYFQGEKMTRSFCKISLSTPKRYWDQQTWLSSCLAMLLESLFQAVFINILEHCSDSNNGAKLRTCQVFQCQGEQRKLLGCRLLGGSVPRLKKKKNKKLPKYAKILQNL